MHRIVLSAVAPLVLLAPQLRGQETANWPQFRGPNASGIVAPKSAIPVEFGPSQKLIWKQEIPSGHSSPVIWGERIFLTSFDKAENKLELLCLARKNGEILWRRAVPAESIEKVHQISSPASASPATDGERVYAYFGSYGVASFDFDGKPAWAVKMPVPETRFGSGTSPVVTGDLVILNRDQNKDGYLIALDRRSGKTMWKQPLASAMGAESYSTPVIWRDQVILHRAGAVEGFDLKDGKRRWWLNAQTTGTSTPAFSQDTIYAAAWFPFGEADQIVTLPSFAELVKQADKDGDGKLSAAEFPADLAAVRRPDAPAVPGATIFLKPYFKMLDQNGDGILQENEWDMMRGMMSKMRADHGLIAFKPGEGDLTANVIWKEKSAIPEVPTPLAYDKRVYMVRNGGIVSCVDGESGKLVYRARLGAGGPYYSSPIAGDGRIIVASGEGTVVVFAAGDKLEVLARNELKEDIYATPAAAGNVLYVRTARRLYAFGNK